MDRVAWQGTVCGVTGLDITERLTGLLFMPPSEARGHVQAEESRTRCPT